MKTTKGKYTISTTDIRTCVAKILFWMYLSCSWIKDMKSVLAIFNREEKNTERASYLQRCNNKHQTCLFEVPQFLGCWDSVRDFRLWPPSSNPLMAVCAMRMGCRHTLNNCRHTPYRHTYTYNHMVQICLQGKAGPRNTMRTLPHIVEARKMVKRHPINLPAHPGVCRHRVIVEIGVARWLPRERQRQ